jgi:hypothetical protein
MAGLRTVLAHRTIATGEPALTGYDRVPPRIGRMGWVNVLWMLLAVTKLFQLGGIVVSSVAIGLLGVYTLLQVFGVGIG